MHTPEAGSIDYKFKFKIQNYRQCSLWPQDNRTTGTNYCKKQILQSTTTMLIELFKQGCIQVECIHVPNMNQTRLGIKYKESKPLFLITWINPTNLITRLKVAPMLAAL